MSRQIIDLTQDDDDDDVSCIEKERVRVRVPFAAKCKTSIKDLSAALESLSVNEKETVPQDDELIPKTIGAFKDYQFQKEHIGNMLSIFQRRFFCLDVSQTGLGKTRCAIMTAKALGYKMIICCPKPAMSSWYRELKKVDYLDNVLTVTNFDVFRLGKWFDLSSAKNKATNPDFWTELKSTPCPYIKKSVNPATNITEFAWDLPNNVLVVCDEAHKAKNKKTQNAGLLIGIRKFISQQEPETNHRRVLLLTATPIEKEKNIAFLLYLLGYISKVGEYRSFMKTRTIADVHRLLFSQKLGIGMNKFIAASRMTMELAKKEFQFVPIADIRCELLDMPEEVREKIEQKNTEIRIALEAIKLKKEIDGTCALVVLLRARQEIEALKVDSYIYLAREKLKQGYSVLVFLNFRESVHLVEDAFRGDERFLREEGANDIKTVVKIAKIIGGQKPQERLAAEEMFQTGKANLLLCTISSGGASISLHDTDGGRPRYALVSTPWSASDVVQLCGRTNRVGSMSHPIYRILFCRKTVEEIVARKLDEKMGDMDTFISGKYDGALLDWVRSGATLIN